MGFFSKIVLRRASAWTTTVRGIRNQRNYCSAIVTPLNFNLKKSSPIVNTQELCSRTFLPTLNFSSLANKKPTSDGTLIRVIESEIKCAEESDDHNRVEKTPEGFPFEIEDNDGQRTILLKREYQGEVIKVEVHMPNLVTGDDEDGGDDDDDNDKATQSSIPLVVTVSKTTGPCLEFDVTAFPDEVSIDSMSVKESDTSEDQVPYEGPDFTTLDDNLQKAFHKYLEIRGIKPSTTNFLYEYMIDKDSREYLMWLKNLKTFIQK